MYIDHGVGLAAPQVGINKRIMVFNEHGDRKQKSHEIILINPVIKSYSEEKNFDEESCLSFPFILGKVARHNNILVEYQDVHNKSHTLELFGYSSRIFQHEYDHLEQVRFD
jgi:peptide deformylase